MNATGSHSSSPTVLPEAGAAPERPKGKISGLELDLEQGSCRGIWLDGVYLPLRGGSLILEDL